MGTGRGGGGRAGEDWGGGPRGAVAPFHCAFYTELNDLESHRGHTLLSKSPWDNNTGSIHQPGVQLRRFSYSFTSNLCIIINDQNASRMQIAE